MLQMYILSRQLKRTIKILNQTNSIFFCQSRRELVREGKGMSIYRNMINTCNNNNQTVLEEPELS